MSCLNVLYQCNDAYAEVTGVSIQSLCESNMHISQLCVYLLDDHISRDNLARIASITEQFGRPLHVIDTEEMQRRLIELRVAPFKGTYTTYFKLMALSMLDVPGGKILQLDGDTIVVGSLDEIAEIDMEGALIKATYDCTMNSYKRLIGIPEEDKYYNCGVILVDLKKWKDEECESKIVEHLRNQRSAYYTVDQDIINVLFRNMIAYLDPRYNLNSGFYIYGVKESLKMYGLKTPWYDDAETIKKAMAAPAIHHCMGAMTGRPWEQNSIHPMNELYDSYRRKTPWACVAKVMPKRDAVFRVQRALYQSLPRCCYIPLHQIGQFAYLSSMNHKVQKIRFGRP